LISNGDNLPDASRVVRFAGFNKMFKDEDENIQGPSVDAFQLRPTEDYLSVTWCEYFSGSEDQQLRCAIEAIRRSRDVGAKACFCVAKTDDLTEVGAEWNATVRHVYHPEPSNPAHAGVYGFSPEEAELLDRLADEVWSCYLTKDDADALPLIDCEKSPLVD